MPGEMRPSLTSVAPYDDYAETLISKVETIDNEISLRKKPSTKKGTHLKNQNDADLSAINALQKIEQQKDKLLQSKQVVANGGKQLERTNYVRINQNKKGSYKPAIRGAAFQNKLMANKRNAMKFRNRMQ